MDLPTIQRRARQRARALLSRLVERLPDALRGGGNRSAPTVDSVPSLYERLYERLAVDSPPESSIGAGDYQLIGAIELGLLKQEGLRSDHTVVDFGCGTGRLAVHLIPELTEGEYIGIDISETMLVHASANVARRLGAVSRRYRFLKQTTDAFSLSPESVDMLCAFSVFTHLEHEDTYRYLRAMFTVVRPGGKCLASCLPLSLDVARRIFLQEAALGPSERWARVRSIATTREFMEVLAEMAGWRMVRWYGGDEQNVETAGHGRQALGQSTLVLAKPASPNERHSTG